MPVHRRILVHMGNVICTAARQRQMKASGRNVGMTWQYPFTMHGLRNDDAAQAVEALGKRIGKAGRHMLCDHDARTVRWQGLQYLTDRFSATGGCANDDEL